MNFKNIPDVKLGIVAVAETASQWNYQQDVDKL